MIELHIFLDVLLQGSVPDPNEFNNFLIFGYAAMGFIGLAYVISLLNRQRNMQEDLQLMQRLLEAEEQDELRKS